MNLHCIQSGGARSELSEKRAESFAGHFEEVDGLISGEEQRVGSSRGFEPGSAWTTRTPRCRDAEVYTDRGVGHDPGVD
jgi:hypothetical protein